LPRSTLVRVGIAHVRSSIYVAQSTSDSQSSAVLPSHPTVTNTNRRPKLKRSLGSDVINCKPLNSPLALPLLFSCTLLQIPDIKFHAQQTQHHGAHTGLLEKGFARTAPLRTLPLTDQSVLSRAPFHMPTVNTTKRLPRDRAHELE
jgi:hypothetical protein